MQKKIKHPTIPQYNTLAFLRGQRSILGPEAVKEGQSRTQRRILQHLTGSEICC